MTSTLKVGVLGAGGRMGREVCRAVSQDLDLDLVAAVDPHHTVYRSASGDLDPMGPESKLPAMSTPSSAPGRRVAVDFTVADVALQTIEGGARPHGVTASWGPPASPTLMWQRSMRSPTDVGQLRVGG